MSEADIDFELSVIRGRRRGSSVSPLNVVEANGETRKITTFVSRGAMAAIEDRVAHERRVLRTAARKRKIRDPFAPAMASKNFPTATEMPRDQQVPWLGRNVGVRAPVAPRDYTHVASPVQEFPWTDKSRSLPPADSVVANVLRVLREMEVIDITTYGDVSPVRVPLAFREISLRKILLVDHDARQWWYAWDVDHPVETYGK